MANHKSSQKCIRQIAKRTVVNQHRRTTMRTVVKKATVALTPASRMTVDEIKAKVIEAESNLMRSAQKGIIKKKTASRKVSRMVKRLKALEVL